MQLFKKIYYVNDIKDDVFMSMTKEEQRLYKLTQCNTLLNRDFIDKSEAYMKNVELDYKDIYGIKGIKYCNDRQKCSKSIPKKKSKVQFSNDIQYSRN